LITTTQRQQQNKNVMAGTTSSSGANSATGNNHASTQLHGPTGREWAIESLIDRDPEGCFYRAARVVVSI
jgi:hypothetical protein